MGKFRLDVANGTFSRPGADTPLVIKDDDGLETENADGLVCRVSYPVAITTTDSADPTEMKRSASLTLPELVAKDVWAYSGMVLGVGVAGTNAGKIFHATLRFTVKRVSNTVTILNSSLEVISNDVPGTWALSVSTASYRPVIQVTGDAASTVDWRGYFDAIKLAYP